VSKARHISDLIASRRALLGGLAGLPLLNLSACATSAGARAGLPPPTPVSFASVAPTNADTVTLPPGYRWQTLIAWGDALFDSVPPTFDPNALTRAEQEQRFGQNADMLALFPVQYAFPPSRDVRDGDRFVLCANNEYVEPALMFPAKASPRDFTAQDFEACLAATGISVVTVERAGSQWLAVRDTAPGAGLNRRITPFSPMVFDGPGAGHPWIAAAANVVNAREPGTASGEVRCGTSANCAGGLTPWGTYLSSEENFDYLFVASDDNAPELVAARQDAAFVLDAENFSAPRRGQFSHLFPRQFDMSGNPHGPSLYGWIVEVDPHDPSWTPRKHTALGRKKGECATTALTRSRHVAVYMGDDQADEFVYKFISRNRFNPRDRTSNRALLESGQLYVARFEEDGSGEWMAITVNAANAAAREAGYTALFRDEADLMMRSREAARLMGATPMDRPEDVEALLDPNWVGLGPVLIVCTKNSSQGFAHPGNPRRESPTPNRAQSNAAGHIVRIDEAGADCGATRFTWDVFVMGGDPAAEALVVNNRGGRPVHVSADHNGAPTFAGDRFACPDNICVDAAFNVWIATDGSDEVFANCNDGVLVAPTSAEGPRPVKRFLVGPMGAEICGPFMAPDERSFFCAIQHPGENDLAGTHIAELRWSQRQRPPSSFPYGNGAWPRSAVVVVTREDGGKVGT
jgi:uncharacterized protein